LAELCHPKRRRNIKIKRPGRRLIRFSEHYKMLRLKMSMTMDLTTVLIKVPTRATVIRHRLRILLKVLLNNQTIYYFAWAHDVPGVGGPRCHGKC